MNRSLFSSATVLLAAASPAFAQDAPSLEGWDPMGIDEPVLASRLIDAVLMGVEGEALGEIENLYIDPEGRLSEVMVEDGGALGLGERHVIVPWNALEHGPEGLRLPIAEGDLERYSPFAEARVDQVARTFRASDLLGDLVMLKGEVGLGVIQDLVFEGEGALRAVAVTADRVGSGLSGTYLLPFQGYDTGEFDPIYSSYYLPYSLEEVSEAPVFDAAAFGD